MMLYLLIITYFFIFENIQYKKFPRQQRCVLALSNSRNRLLPLARLCMHILSCRGIRRALSQTILLPLAAAPLTGCYNRLFHSDLRSIIPMIVSACSLRIIYTVLALSNSRNPLLTLARLCVHILSCRGIRRAWPQTILPPTAAASAGCSFRLVYSDFRYPIPRH